MSAARRRALSITAVSAAFAVAIGLLPLLVTVAIAADVLTAPRRWRNTRLLAMVLWALAVELAAVAAAAGLWIRFGLGTRLDSAASERAHFALQKWYTGSLLTAARVTCRLEIEIEDPTPAQGGNAVVIGRHTSIGDALIPAVLFAEHFDIRTRYVLKDDLLWAPAFDIVGRRLNCHFVNRIPIDSQTELDALRKLSTGLDERSVAVIFPEGTFFTPQRHARAVERLRASSQPQRAERAEQLRHLLPPRPAGTLALLEGAPRADAVVVGNIGFEQFTSLGRIYRSVPFRRPVVVWLWRVPNADIPREPDRRVDWLYDQWERLDAAVQVRQAERSTRAAIG